VIGDPAYRAALDHAWAWFTVHASQRLQLVNFWIVSVAFLTTALVTTMTTKNWGIGCLVALAGALITLCFHGLERRTRQLVRAGEAALRKFQLDLAMQASVPEMEMLSAADKPGRLGSYGDVIRVMHWSVFTAFLTAAIFALIKWVQ
jgi:hypothetical protein